jgi:hypothetical protein
LKGLHSLPYAAAVGRRAVFMHRRAVPAAAVPAAAAAAAAACIVVVVWRERPNAAGCVTHPQALLEFCFCVTDFVKAGVLRTRGVCVCRRAIAAAQTEVASAGKEGMAWAGSH